MVNTVNNKLYSVNSRKKLFLPTGFNSPSNIKGLEGEYELVDTETDSKLFFMYKKMGIEEQTAERYIKEIIIPFLENSNSIEERREVLKWLSKEIENITKDSDNGLIDVLKKSKIIPSRFNENRLDYAYNFYYHEIKLPMILETEKYTPILFDDYTIQEKWSIFLEKLNISHSILPQHIVEKVEFIIHENNQQESIELLEYISLNLDFFNKIKYNNQPILEYLQDYSWFPVEKPDNVLKPKERYSELQKSNKLILFNDIKIAGGYYHVLNKKLKLKKDISEKLGIVTKIPDEYFFESFRELMTLSPTNNQVVNYTEAVYKYIGINFLGKKIDFDENEKSILINNRWIAPKYVYQYKIKLTGIYSWDNLIGDESNSDLAKGLISLGVREKPTFDFFIEQLQKLPQEQILNSNQLNDAKVLLEEIQNYDKNAFDSELPILTEENQLILSSKLYINDLPAYKNAQDKNRSLYFAHSQFKKLAQKLNLLSISKNHTSEIYYSEESKSTHQIINILERDSFKEGILRLLYNERKIGEDEINNSTVEEVLPSDITFVSTLTIKYSIENNFLFRSDENAYKENGKLYILEQDDEDDMIEIIAKYICDSKNLSRDSFGWIERIMRNKMNREELYNFLNKKKVIELSQKFDIKDEVEENIPIKDIKPNSSDKIKSTNTEQRVIRKKSYLSQLLDKIRH